MEFYKHIIKTKDSVSAATLIHLSYQQLMNNWENAWPIICRWYGLDPKDHIFNYDLSNEFTEILINVNEVRKSGPQPNMELLKIVN